MRFTVADDDIGQNELVEQMREKIVKKDQVGFPVIYIFGILF
jgi:hypothetical protein